MTHKGSEKVEQIKQINLVSSFLVSLLLWRLFARTPVGDENIHGVVYEKGKIKSFHNKIYHFASLDVSISKVVLISVGFRLPFNK